MEAIDKSRIFMLELMFGYLHYEEHICGLQKKTNE